MKYAHFITHVRNYATLCRNKHTSYAEQVRYIGQLTIAQGREDFGGGTAGYTAVIQNVADIIVREYAPSDANVPQTQREVEDWLKEGGGS